MAVGAWIVMAWNRFGLQGFSAPRAGTRFVLIGFYCWVGLAIVVWLAARLSARSSEETVSVVRLTQLTGLSHRPLIVLAVLLQVLALFDPAGDIGGIAALVVFGLWMPAMLVTAVVWAYDRPLLWAITVVAIPYSLWLATAGRYLFIQVGHLF